jgi:hypothetical protein
MNQIHFIFVLVNFGEAGQNLAENSTTGATVGDINQYIVGHVNAWLNEYKDADMSKYLLRFRQMHKASQFLKTKRFISFHCRVHRQIR